MHSNVGCRSEEGWLFDPQSGSYYSVDLAADWNPEDGRGWRRSVSNFSKEFIRIDPNTGFSLAVNYHPKTVSNSSDLFDEVLNPVNVEQFATISTV